MSFQYWTICYILYVGMAIKLGGVVASWHNGLQYGFWVYVAAVSIIATGYVNLALCISEMVSVVAFPGKEMKQ